MAETSLNPTALATDEIHVWTASLQVDPARERSLYALLDADERERVERRRIPRARAQLIVSRGLLRERLAGYLACAPADVSIGYGAHDKPYLVGENPLSFNISHSGDVVLIAIARMGVVGVDVEQLQSVRDLDAVARRFFSDSERRALDATPEHERMLAFYRCWTRKEAVIKAHGGGFSIPLDQFDVSVGAIAALEGSRARALEDEALRLYDLNAPSGYAAALACSHKNAQIHQCTIE